MNINKEKVEGKVEEELVVIINSVREEKNVLESNIKKSKKEEKEKEKKEM